jgi:hypothetical protein
MSTNSVLARPTGDGGWEGRCCHWNGAPTHQARVLLELVAGADGDVDQIRHYLIDQHTGWSTLGGDQSQPTDYVPVAEIPDITHDPEGWKRHQRRNQCYCHGDRHERGPLVHSSDPPDVPWVYVLEDPTLRILYGRPWGERQLPAEVARLPWGVPADQAALLAVECGQDLQRCQHIAGVHFPELDGTPSAGLGTGKWLGREPLGLHDVAEVLVGGRRFTVHGGRLERHGSGYGNRWFGYLRDADGRSMELPIAQLDDGRHQPTPGVMWLYPPTQAELTTGQPDQRRREGGRQGQPPLGSADRPTRPD